MEAEQRADQRGLAGAVRAEQADGLSGARHAEPAGDLVQDLPPAQANAKSFQFNNWRLSAACPILARPGVARRPSSWSTACSSSEYGWRPGFVPFLRSPRPESARGSASSAFNDRSAEDRATSASGPWVLSQKKPDWCRPLEAGQLRLELLGADQREAAARGWRWPARRGRGPCSPPSSRVVGPRAADRLRRVLRSASRCGRPLLLSNRQPGALARAAAARLTASTGGGSADSSRRRLIHLHAPPPNPASGSSAVSMAKVKSVPSAAAMSSATRTPALRLHLRQFLRELGI